jgi:hypothetical protein
LESGQPFPFAALSHGKRVRNASALPIGNNHPLARPLIQEGSRRRMVVQLLPWLPSFIPCPMWAVVESGNKVSKNNRG